MKHKEWFKLEKICGCLGEESGICKVYNYTQLGWNTAKEECAKIAEALDSNKGNEKEIVKAIRSRET